jgi:hypothetical protein
MPKTPASPPAPEPAATPAALQAQILATEHWSILASRTTTQNEVLTRISMFLTFVSATLVSLALVGQVTGFGSAFPVFAISVLAVALVVGVLTQVRVFNVAEEDLMYVVAMNRLRAAYAELAPGVDRWFMSSPHDDEPGAMRTYFFFRARGGSAVLGSSMAFIAIVDAALTGLLVATILIVAGLAPVGAFIAAIVLAVAFFAASLLVGYRSYRRTWREHTAMSPTRAA